MNTRRINLRMDLLRASGLATVVAFFLFPSFSRDSDTEQRPWGLGAVATVFFAFSPAAFPFIPLFSDSIYEFRRL